MKFNRNGLDFMSFNKSEEQNDFVSDMIKDKDIKKHIPQISYKIKKINTEDLYENGYLVKDPQTDEFIGFVYFGSPYRKEADLNYAVHADHRSEGYGRRILKACSDLILEKDKSIDNIVLIISPDNFRSKRAAEAAGFTQDGNIRYVKKR